MLAWMIGSWWLPWYDPTANMSLQDLIQPVDLYGFYDNLDLLCQSRRMSTCLLFVSRTAGPPHQDQLGVAAFLYYGHCR